MFDPDAFDPRTATSKDIDAWRAYKAPYLLAETLVPGVFSTLMVESFKFIRSAPSGALARTDRQLAEDAWDAAFALAETIIDHRPRKP